MIVEECSIDCVDTIKKIIGEALSWFHAYYASICIETGKCRAVICRNRDAALGVGVFYTVDTKPTSIGVIYYVAVEQSFRGFGIGKAIVASIEELMEASGTGFYIATTRYDNIAARRMLEELGYTGIMFEDIDDNLREVIEELTCAYEDDLLYIKSTRPQSKPFMRMLLDKTNHRIIRELWTILCYRPWIMLRRRR